MRNVSGQRRTLAASVLLAMATLPRSSDAQSLSYSRGQNVAPAYEGWERDANGTRYFLFGYMNRNWEEELDVPVGADNSFSPGAADRGQPTHLLPRRNRFVFRVPVPAGFTEKDELVWTLTTNGRTERAYASLRTDYQVDDVVKASETGALGAGTSSPEIRANKPPVITMSGARARTARVGEPLVLTANVVDDGVPNRRTAGLSGAASARPGSASTSVQAGTGSSAPINREMLPPRRTTVGKNVGLHLSWIVYRGAGGVHFTPPQTKVWEDTRTGANSPWAPFWTPPELPPDGAVAAQVVFDQPGTYVLRAVADDGALTTAADLTITVSAPAGAAGGNR